MVGLCHGSKCASLIHCVVHWIMLHQIITLHYCSTQAPGSAPDLHMGAKLSLACRQATKVTEMLSSAHVTQGRQYGGCHGSEADAQSKAIELFRQHNPEAPWIEISDQLPASASPKASASAGLSSGTQAAAEQSMPVSWPMSHAGQHESVCSPIKQASSQQQSACSVVPE